jgi:hypothetical protein
MLLRVLNLGIVAADDQIRPVLGRRRHTNLPEGYRIKQGLAISVSIHFEREKQQSLHSELNAASDRPGVASPVPERQKSVVMPYTVRTRVKIIVSVRIAHVHGSR